MLKKSYTDNGQKALHMKGNEDRALAYKSWLRTFDANGMFCDVDMIKWRTEGGELVPTVMTEITRFDGDDEVSAGYLTAILNRYFLTEKQGEIMRAVSKRLKIPAYIVLFQKDLKWLWVYSLRKECWRRFDKAGYILFISQF